MQLNRLGIFIAGATLSATTFGAASYVSAMGGTNLKACANKTTGVMRYLSKGKCKKTEITLTWNQIGLQGPVGPSGPAGSNGVNGVDGVSPDVSTFALKSEIVKQTLSTTPLEAKAIGLSETIALQPNINRATTAEVAGGSTQAFTTKFRIPLDYRGRITGSCPTNFPIPVAAAYLGLKTDGSRFSDGYGGFREDGAKFPTPVLMGYWLGFQ